MTPKQLEAIRRHGEQLLALFPNATERDPVELCKKLRRLEAAAHRHAERMCSDADYHYEQHTQEPADEKCLRAVRKLLGSDRPWINSDPRGYALKVDLAPLPIKVVFDGQAWWAGPANTPWVEPRPCFETEEEARAWAQAVYRERLHTDLGGYGILAPEIGPEG